ncbi:DEAD/DEAH box helicase [Streptomonospora nanhaiensis]|uniref:Superfamily II DNA or RNA helicase n=1 Tax=Streptomonospora nanhaiensis TaxID=1323731 RepID=A0A853BI30_9ACTN|nr:SNF2-related protein [Streptomonospora nanhaiensis]NYI94186.1 superfamily II DNA or RNA helicase [Streptomonospora nanhaiensis]
MLVLHGWWRPGAPGAPGALLVWGEHTPPRAAAARPGVHPFAASPARLRTALAGLAPSAAASVERAALRLPTAQGAPLPSPAHHTPAPQGAAPAWATWRVPALRLGPAAAQPLLLALPATGPTPAGPALAHLQALAAFAARLTARGHLLPALTPAGAQWRPVLTGAAQAHLDALAAALPPSAQAEDPHIDPSTLLLDALTHLADAHARTLLAPGPAPAHPLAAALAAPRPRPLTATPPGLGGHLSTWHRDARRARTGTTLLLRLRDPHTPQEPWHLEFWAASRADPTLQIPAAALWQDPDHAAALGTGAGTALLTHLRAAARHYPALAPAAAQAAPTHLPLTLAQAHTFITTHAPRLTDAGISVVLPEWVGRRRLALRMTTRERPAAPGGGIGADDLLDVSLAAVCDDDTLDLDELTRLARLKQPLVHLRGRWLQADPAHLRAVVAFLRRRGRGALTRAQALRLALSPASQAPLPITGLDADGPLGDLLAGGAHQRLRPLPDPPGFTAHLRPYQRRGAAWLQFLDRLGLGAVLADDMGLGKTVQLLALLAAERAPDHPAPPGPTLLVCPVSLLGNWRREAEKFTPRLRLHTHHGPRRARGNDLARAAGAADLVLTTYGTLRRDTADMAALPWDRVVCDEAQALKNADSAQAQAVRMLPARTRIALTGTPVENNLEELWAVVDFTNPGLLGTRQAFTTGLAARASRAAHHDTPDTPGTEDAAALLRRITGPFILRRLKTDRAIITDLPAKHEMRTWCTLTPEQATLYQAAVDDMAARLDQADRRERNAAVLATLGRLKQICNHPAQFLNDGSPLAGRSGKLTRLEDLLEQAVRAGDKALCFTQYTALGQRLAPHLQQRLGVEVLWLHGGTPRHRREEITARFQNAPHPMVLLLSLKAAGTGLNLTAANHVVHIDRWWNPAVEDQATDRAFRIGQRRDVQVRKLVCVGTVEERIDDLIERKRRLAQAAVATGEHWLADLTTDHLRDLVRLAPEAVAA